MSSDHHHHHQTTSDQELTISSDLPPESFYVPLDNEQEWFNCNAMMQRKASLKLGFNRNLKNNTSSFEHRSRTANRKQAAGKSSSSVLALPKVQRNSNDGDRVNEKKINGRFLLRTRSDSGVKSVVQPYEPGSPRVSCTGRIGSKNVEGGGKRAGFFRAFGSMIRNGSRRSDRDAKG